MDYGFFDYKYLIENNSRDANSIYRYMFTVVALVAIFVIGFLCRKAKREKITMFLRVVSIFLIVLEVSKVTWESYYDITIGDGFNAGGRNSSGILPLETCSLFMYICATAGFTRNDKVRRCCVSWLVTIGFVAGLSNIFVPQGLNYYPFWTFGAFHNMIYHFALALTAMILVFNRYYDFEFKDIIRGFIPHAICSTVVITIDYITTWNYMLYRNPSAFPIINLITDKLFAQELYWANTLIVIAMFIFFDVLFMSIYIGAYKLIDTIKAKKNPKLETVNE